MLTPENEVVRTLSAVSRGDSEAASGLMELVYEPLRKLAHHYLRGQARRNTLQPTALVHEVFLRIAGNTEVAWNDRNHFFALCARAMRGILADHARKRNALKRGGSRQPVTLSCAVAPKHTVEIDILDLETVLAQLEALSERQARIVECRYFSGMTHPEIAQVLGVSLRTVNNDWAMARAWISMRL